jgi:hypothetical protein
MAVAVTALSGGALVASAAATAATGPAHTSLGIRAQHSHLAAGHSDHIAGALRAAGAPAAGRSIDLEARPRGATHFTTAGTATTGAHGRVVFTVTPATTTRYELRFAGDAGDRPSHSGVVTVRVAAEHHRRLGSALSIRLGRKVIGFGDSDRVVGRLTHRHHGLQGRHVALQSRRPGTLPWTVVADHVTGNHGLVGFTVSPTTSTRYRLVFNGGALLRPSHSPGRTIVVRQQQLSIDASPRSIDAGQSATVSGVLTDRGAPSPGVTIDLRARPVGPHAHFTTIGSAVTAADGSVSFPVSPTVSTRYRLVEPATTTTGRVASHLATVTVRTATSLSIRAKHVTTGGEAISGALRGGGHGLRGRKVTLQQRPAGGTTWTPVRTKLTGRNGSVRFHVAEPAASTDYQLVFAGGPRYDGSVSGIVTVTES